ncbi:MAG: hypothetical protein HY785_15720 [Oscillatoriophycideae cyanobacterium NC_groundwater_1537_Pr4_S-0.65um_50_18]|nr:hypothetical protein [Oscillatoriophycideae cyanobacterium NC_groundwater_1537_Pr4_S-0.65um_50_18]
MIDPIDDIVRQARQGSVSAIIQVLNEKLSSSGIRTRAMFVQGVLQLLCEAAKPEQLEQPIVVPQVQQILQSLQPRNIRRVNVNSRIVREQQLLWLEEISRDPQNQLLWSEEIVLRQPNPFKRFIQDWKDNSPDAMSVDLSKTPSKHVEREQRVFWRGLVGGAGLSVVLLLLGWVFSQWLTPQLAEQKLRAGEANAVSDQPEASLEAIAPSQNRPATAIPSASPVGSPTSSTSSPVPNAVGGSDPFADAVRLAQETVTAGQNAQSSADWLRIAAQWQTASDLMSVTPIEDSRYAVAQDRVVVYRQNSEAALQQAQNQPQ